jgi:hypothetical protein
MIYKAITQIFSTDALRFFITELLNALYPPEHDAGETADE